MLHYYKIKIDINIDLIFYYIIITKIDINIDLVN
jgi:hypothetical protein